MAYLALGGGIALLLDVGRIRHEKEHARLPVLGEPSVVHDLSVHRGLVHLEIARMHDRAHGRPYGKSAGVHDGVAHAYELDVKGAYGDPVPGPYRLEGGALQDVELRQLFLYEPYGERGGVDGGVYLSKDKGQGAGVVLVAVGYDEGLYLIGVGLQVAHVRDDDVDAEHVVLGEHEAAVDDYDGVSVLHRHHVEAYLAKPAKGYYL